MAATACSAVRRSRRTAPRHSAARAASALIVLGALAAPLSARAAVGASLTAESDYRFRGVSLSDDRPVATLDVAADFANGVYLGASALGVWTAHSGFKALGLQEYVGYARRLNPDLTGDVGFTNANYTDAYIGGAAARNQEIYVGLSGHGIAGRLFYSPNYFNLGYPTLYGELNGVVRPRPRWRLSGHVGVLTRVDDRGGDRAHFDWRLGVAREFDALTLEAAVTGSNGGDEDHDHARSDTAAVVALSWAF